MTENRGGKREGAGRKSIVKLFHTLSVAKKRKSLLKYATEEDLEKIMKALVKSAKTDKSDRKYLLDQVMGKSLQSTDLTTGGEKIESFNDEQVSRVAKRIADRSNAGGTADGSPGVEETPD